MLARKSITKQGAGLETITRPFVDWPFGFSMVNLCKNPFFIMSLELIAPRRQQGAQMIKQAPVALHGFGSDQPGSFGKTVSLRLSNLIGTAIGFDQPASIPIVHFFTPPLLGATSFWCYNQTSTFKDAK
jgi:hypothetical protein